MPYDAQVVADSVSPQGTRLTTVVVTHPSSVRDQLLAYRMFSRNSVGNRTVITATEWDNFLSLRANPHANPKLVEVAERIYGAIEASEPNVISEGKWHLPFIQPDERNGVWEHTHIARRVSIGRCARADYLVDGERDLVTDQALFETLIEQGHVSPLEHIATPFTADELRMRRQVRLAIRQLGSDMDIDSLAIDQLVKSTAFCGPLNSWTSYRKLLWGEGDLSLFLR